MSVTLCAHALEAAPIDLTAEASVARAHARPGFVVVDGFAHDEDLAGDDELDRQLVACRR